MKNVIHAIGHTVGGRYQIVSEIGQGGMQEVYRAKDILLGRDVALKVPKNNSAVKRFKRSATLSAQVNHSNVAKTLDYLEEAGRSYLIEELVVGTDLSEILSSSVARLDPYVVAHALHHLAKGIAASHHADVVHRDLKPSNVMVVGGSSILGFKITDFGIAKLTEQEIGEAVEGGSAGLTASQTALGALPYMAPEMIDDMKSAGKPADIWALGAMTYELLTGVRPFGQGYKAVPAIMAANLPPLPPILLSKPQFSVLATQIDSIVRSCINKDPAARPSADQVVAACEGLCYGLAPREFGTIESFEHNKYGFIKSESKSRPSAFYHIDSVYGVSLVSVGQRVWFSRFSGFPRDRAFPVVLAI